jgi:hypothetical protein
VVLVNLEKDAHSDTSTREEKYGKGKPEPRGIPSGDRTALLKALPPNVQLNTTCRATVNVSGAR